MSLKEQLVATYYARRKSVAEMVWEAYAKWEESKHPRDESGQFSESGGGKSLSKPTAKVAKPKKAPKISIADAAGELAARGYSLNPRPVRQDFAARQTWYAITGPDGKERTMTAAEIGQFIESTQEAETKFKADMVDSIRARLKLFDGERENYAKDENWVTIGAQDGSGGTPVKLDGQGNIVAGPEKLTGHNVNALPKRKDLIGRESSGGSQGRLPMEADDRKGPTAAEKAKWGDNVEFKPDGRVVGTAMLPVSEIEADPERFQFKVSGIGEEGVTEELKEVKRFRPEFAGQLLVWKDPADGKTYVVNGHHRHELANRTGYEGKIPVFAVDAKDATEARALGALANIAEGRGTAVDAAKFMRDMKVGVDEIREHGISLKGKVADEGAALSKLSDKLFKRLVNEDLRESRALAIAKELPDRPEFQDKLAKIVEDRDARGRSLSDSDVAEMAREMAVTPTVREKGFDLFGEFESEESLFVERNELKSFIKGQLSEERRTFKAVSKSGRDARLSQAGNVLDSDKNKTIAQQAAEEYETFDRESNLKGPISDAINRAAAELKSNPRRKKAIGNRLAQELRELARNETADPGAKESFARALRGDTGSAEGGRLRVDGSEESLVERFAKAYEALGYPCYRPSLSIREMVFRAYYGSVERYGKQFDESKVKRDSDGKFAEKPGGGQNQKGLFGEDFADKPKSKEFDNKGGKQQNLFSGLDAKRGQQDLFDDLDKRDDDGTPKNLFKPAELSLSKDASHKFRDKDSAYSAAQQLEQKYKALMDMGEGVVKRLNGTTINIDSKEAFEAMLADFDSGKSKGPVVVLAPIKGIERAAEKARTDYGNDWGQMKDLVRGTVAVDTVGEISGAIQAVRDEMESRGWTLAQKPKDRFANPTGGGYRDILMVLKGPGGMMAELQVHTKAMLAAKELRGHKLYEEQRTIDGKIKENGGKASPEQVARIDELESQQAAVYNAAWEKSRGK